jgi:hypothetical protein
MHAVRRDLQAATNAGRVGPSLIDRRVDAGTLEEKRGDRACDAGADVLRNMTLSRPKARVALLQELEEAMRRTSAQGVLFGQTVANVAGISGSDLDCMDFLNLEGRMTAGRLAELTGLTTGAITGVIDRLEKAGFVRRERD